jgi:hypothetical protein
VVGSIDLREVEEHLSLEILEPTTACTTFNFNFNQVLLDSTSEYALLCRKFGERWLVAHAHCETAEQAALAVGQARDFVAGMRGSLLGCEVARQWLEVGGGGYGG